MKPTDRVAEVPLHLRFNEFKTQMQRYLCICVLTSLKRWPLRKSKEIGVETMKKLLATILALVMALPLCTVSWAAETQDVAEAGGTKYESLQDAINAADGQTV